MEKFRKVITDLTDLFHQLIGIEQVKLRAVSTHQVAMVEECMNKEQALLLKLRGLELERERAQEKAGFGGMRFREILEQVSSEEREALLPLFEGLSQAIQMFKNVNSDANTALATNLHMVEKVLDMKNGGVYDGKGRVMPERPLTSHRV